MKIGLKLHIILLFALLSPAVLYAQENIRFSHYQLNQQFYNPAYAGAKAYLESAITYRKQWEDIAQAPTTALLSAHAPIPSKKLGLGAIIYTDKLGVKTSSGLLLNCSYKLKINQTATLAMGIQAGIISKQIKWSELTQFDPNFTGNDPMFPTQNESSFAPNFGLGMYYYTKSFGVGVAIPRLLSNNLPNKDDAFNMQNSPIYLQTNALLAIDKDWSIAPSAMLMYSQKSIFQINCNVIYNSGVLAGVGYSTDKLAMGTLGYQINQKLKIVYSFQYNLNNNYGKHLNNHEITLNYNIPILKSEYDSPRYF